MLVVLSHAVLAFIAGIGDEAAMLVAGLVTARGDGFVEPGFDEAVAARRDRRSWFIRLPMSSGFSN